MKTPEEMAEEYAKDFYGDGEHLDFPDSQAFFLAGYASAQPKWISVKEKVPELGLHVLTYGIYTKDLIVAWLDDCDEFLGMYDWVNEHQSLDQVTHWMPLPEPPKEDE